MSRTTFEMQVEIDNLRGMLIHAELALRAAMVDGCGTARCEIDGCDDCRLVGEVLRDIRTYMRGEG